MTNKQLQPFFQLICRKWWFFDGVFIVVATSISRVLGPFEAESTQPLETCLDNARNSAWTILRQRVCTMQCCERALICRYKNFKTSVQAEYSQVPSEFRAPCVIVLALTANYLLPLARESRPDSSVNAPICTFLHPCFASGWLLRRPCAVLPP